MTQVELILEKLAFGHEYVYITKQLHMIMILMDEVVAKRTNVLFHVRKFGSNYTLTISQ